MLTNLFSKSIIFVNFGFQLKMTIFENRPEMNIFCFLDYIECFFNLNKSRPMSFHFMTFYWSGRINQSSFLFGFKLYSVKIFLKVWKESFHKKIWNQPTGQESMNNFPVDQIKLQQHNPLHLVQTLRFRFWVGFCRGLHLASQWLRHLEHLYQHLLLFSKLIPRIERFS